MTLSEGKPFVLPDAETRNAQLTNALRLTDHLNDEPARVLNGQLDPVNPDLPPVDLRRNGPPPIHPASNDARAARAVSAVDQLVDEGDLSVLRALVEGKLAEIDPGLAGNHHLEERAQARADDRLVSLGRVVYLTVDLPGSVHRHPVSMQRSKY